MVALDFVQRRATDGGRDDGRNRLRVADHRRWRLRWASWASVSALLDKVNDIPFKQIGDNLNGVLKVANTTVNGPQLHQALSNLSATLGSAKDLVENLNSGTGPALRQLPAIATQLQQTLISVNKLVLSLGNGYGGDTQFSQDLDRLLIQTDDAVRSFRSLADLLARHPEALIKGRTGGGTE